jgi:hypothetical protein
MPPSKVKRSPETIKNVVTGMIALHAFACVTKNDIASLITDGNDDPDGKIEINPEASEYSNSSSPLVIILFLVCG